MFTVKFYGCGRTRVYSAESLTILHTNTGGEVTLHQKNRELDFRVDIEDPNAKREEGCPATYEKAIIENANGKTTEIICALPSLGKAA